MLLDFQHITPPHADGGAGISLRVGNGPDGVSAAMADLFHLQRIAETGGAGVGFETLSSVRDLMIESPLAEKRQGLFLFREAARILASVMVRGDGPAAGAAFTALLGILDKAGGFARRTAAEALGGLPHGIRPTRLPAEDDRPPPSVSWRQLRQIARAENGRRPVWIGRSLVSPCGGRRLLVCKFARPGESGRKLAREAFWMSRVRKAAGGHPARFDVPEPIRIDGSGLIRVRCLPEAGETADLSGTAVAFVADAEYFRYPNGTADQGRLPKDAFREVMARSAFWMGRLAAGGMLHTAPIPLFHNRVQVARRRDGGRYEWYRAGRLDRWLASCAFPNFGPTGLRDFEHIEPLDGSRLCLYRCVGTHFLSLMMVCASYFRNRAPDRCGRDESGAPVDVRHLFDRGLLHDTIRDLFHAYYRGLNGVSPDFPLPLDIAGLVSRMIDEMGVDRHMEEILRRVDQEQMTDAEFQRFLAERNCDAASAVRGEKEIVLQTGPHLGAFNSTISLPELIGAVEVFSGLAVAGRFRNSRSFIGL